MSTKSEFEEQWATLTDTVISWVRRSLAQNGILPKPEAENFLHHELQKWFTEGHYQSAWLENLKMSHSESAAQLEGGLEAVSLKVPDAGVADRKWVYFTCWGGGVAGGVVLTRALPPLRGVGGTLALGGGACVFALFLQKKYEQDRNVEAEAIVSQIQISLREQGKALGSIIT